MGDLSGRLIGGRYQIVRKIAEGGMGAVYEAQHNLSKKTIALKVLFAHIGRDDASRQRFMREVSAPAQIGHDGIVEVYDAGFDSNDGSLFVAMEMLRGETMRDRLAHGGHTRDLVLDMFEQLLDPLAAAHAKGIVHRDLKPENVYLHRQRDGREVLKLLDFGIARDLDEKSQSVTQTGMAMGTPHYMAPEQAMSARGVSFPADIWAVGAMMYEALSGKTPFTGETASAIVVHAVSKPHEPLAHAAPATPQALADLVDWCLAKEAENRPRDAGQLLAELRIARGKSPVMATAPMAAPAISQHAITAQVAPQPSGSGAMPTPGPRYGASSVPTPQGPSHGPVTSGYGTAPGASAASFPTPGHVTPPPATSQVRPSSSGLVGRVLLVLGVLGALGAIGLVVVVALGAFASGAVDFGGTGTVHVMAMIPGQLYVDGASQGPLMMGGHDVQLSAGSHRLEVQASGATLASANVEVVAGQVVQLEMRRGVFAAPPGVGAAGGGPTGVATVPTGGGEPLLGSLAPGDRTLSSGEYVDWYDYTWSAGQPRSIEVTTSAFDGYLILRYPSGRQVDVDDPRSTNAFLQPQLDENGVYRVLVTTVRPQQMGAYSLTIR